ncbi:uncharacterized protein C22orf42-like isoform X1 [Callithrix jacchus]
MGNCLGPRAGLSCAWCQEAVAPCCETQSVAAAAPASTTAEPAMLHPGVAEVQHVQPIKSKRHKGLADHARSWVQQKWRHKKICPNENEAPVQDPKECTTEKLQEEMSPDIENATSEYHHSPVEVLQDLILEDIEDDEMPPLCGHDSPK